ncbi:uncharacterized protein LOC143210210 [Lasioglossum baleicum]|uniref:uncharacterized protein LOC143210210 n=1 Tax=Lasioglossum baleicum TaxID=434251 RepID=UPI003FCC9D4D
MKIVIAISCLLAAVVPAYSSLDPDVVIAKYLDYLMPNVQPCVGEFKLSEDQLENMKKLGDMDTKELGCLKSCVMKRLGILTGLDFHIEPIYKMIDAIHKGNQAEITEVTGIAESCLPIINGLDDECAIGNAYTDCCIDKLFN